jgi:hypothetical protein
MKTHRNYPILPQGDQDFPRDPESLQPESFGESIESELPHCFGEFGD